MGATTDNGPAGIQDGSIGPLIVPAGVANGWEPEPGFTEPKSGPIFRRKVRRFSPANDSETETEAKPTARRQTGIPSAATPVEIHGAQSGQEEPARRVTRTTKKEVAKRQAVMTLDILNNIAMGIGGPNAAMRDYEREMIEIPAVAYAETHIKETQYVAEKIAPLTFAVGLTLWLRRAWKESGRPMPKIPNMMTPKPKQPPAPIVPMESQRTVEMAVPANTDIPDMPAPPNGRVVSTADIYSMTTRR